MATKTFEPSVAWPVMIALNGLAVDSNPGGYDKTDGVDNPTPWSDVTAFYAEGMGKGRSNEMTMMLYILNALNPANNPYSNDAHTGPATPPAVGFTLADAAKAVFSGKLTGTTATAAETFANQYSTQVSGSAVAGWDGTADALAAIQESAGLVREKAGFARAMGSLFTMGSPVKGMAPALWNAEHVNAFAVHDEFHAGVALNERQQRGEMFLRRWALAIRVWEAQQRGSLAYLSLVVDREKAEVEATNDRLQLVDDTLQKYWTWRLDAWDYLLESASVLSGSPIQPRDMTRKERLLAAITSSASVGLQTGASTGSAPVGVGMGAVSLFAQLWGMQ